MKRKRRKIKDSVSAEEALPDWLSEEDLKPLPPLEEEDVDVNELDPDDMSVNIEKGIRDLPVWKDLVSRVGLKEARRILRRGLIVQRNIYGNPKN
jgi:hypothetical protein